MFCLKTSNQLDDNELMIGFITKQTLQKLEKEIEPRETTKVYASIREFFVSAASYIVHKFLWNDPIIEHSCFVDFEKRKSVSFQSVKYFVSRLLSTTRSTIQQISCVLKSTCNSSDLLRIVVMRMKMQNSELMFFGEREILMVKRSLDC